MTSQYLQSLRHDAGLSDKERHLLAAVGVRAAEDVDSLLRTFPSIARLGVRLPQLSNAVFQNLAAAYVTASGAAAPSFPTVTFDAKAPPGAAVTEGSVVGAPAPAPAAFAAAVPPPLAAIDLRSPGWPVRNQNPRGTCVSFGATACVEQMGAPGTAPTDMSEQFLYWAIKNHTMDPNPAKDGTWLQFARDALASHGICTEALAPYVNASYPAGANVGGPAPAGSVISAAATQRNVAATYRRNPSGAAARLHGLLQTGRVAAVSLPVFGDPLNPNGPTNWTSPVAWVYGRVLNPPETSVVVGGHCVCITGFEPDPSEPHGGYFILRNSWDTVWGGGAPAPGNTLAPEQGYGEISATYVETYCWELLQL